MQYYFESGSLSLQQFKQALYASAALKIILELSVWTAVLITPLVFIATLLWGIFWVRHGWFRQLQEVPTIDAVAPINMWGWHMAVRLYSKLGVSMDNMDLTTMPPELRHVLASFRKP